MGSEKIVIVDYGMGNVDSLARAVRKCGNDYKVTHDGEALREASHIILPGVGAFRTGMNSLIKTGLDRVLKNIAEQSVTPLLGICIGMHLLMDQGVEGGCTEGLGLIRGYADRLTPKLEEERLPHVGWNNVDFQKESRLFAGLSTGMDYYFVHGYCVTCTSTADVIGTTPYCGEFPSVINRKNIFGVQFHPEKSQDAGLTLLKNFFLL